MEAKDEEDFNKFRKERVPNLSMIDEIRAQDIYTLYSPDKCPTLPGVTTSFHDISSFGVENFSSRDPILKKSTLRSRSVLKKLSFNQMKRTVLNLPSLIEEDLSYLPSVPIYTADETVFDCNLNDTSRIKASKPTTVVNSEDPSITYKINEGSMHLEHRPNIETEESFQLYDEDESWVDLSKHMDSPSPPLVPHAPTSPDRVTPLPFCNGEEYLRLLRDAQKESNQSSGKASVASSVRDTPRDSPKSPPNSPNTELVIETEETPFKGVYINYYNREGDFVRVEKNIETDWIWDWSSRPDQSPPKEWRFIHPQKGAGRGASIRRLMVGNSSLFSRDVLYTLLITNVLSLILGTGIGIWLSKRSGGGTVTLNTVSIN